MRSQPLGPCPACTAPVSGIRHSYGVVSAYPCNCWLTPAQAAPLEAAQNARETP